jgi:hypothetical protein
MYKIILSLILSVFSFNLIAGTIDQNKSDSQYIEYGKKHQCVVKLEGIYPQEEKEIYFYASGVIFKPRWILTAAHVVKNARKCRIICDNKEKIKIEQLVAHPLYEENKFGKYDIAIGFLEKEAAIDFYPELYTADDEVGKICSISGYGITGTFQSTERIVDDFKRAGSNIIETTDKDLLICSLKDNPRTSLEFLICHGDSGGGLFINKKLAGINSCILTEDKKLDSNINDWSGHTRVNLFTDWVKEVMDTIEKSEQAKP